MSALENLPPDQRAVLQMVLQRGRSYDEIAGMLSIDRAAVRQRALDAFDALTPATVLPGPERALVSDYLLGQLPERVAEQVFAYLEASDSDREWASAIAAVVAPLASGALPEIPVGAPLGADALGSGGLEQVSDSPGDASAERIEAVGGARPEAVAGSRPEPARRAEVTPWQAPAAATSGRPRREEPRPSSRRGGAILLGSVAALIVAAIVVVLVTSGGTGRVPTSSERTASTQTVRSTTTRATTSISTATSPTSIPQILAQLNLHSTTGSSATIGVAQVVRVAGAIGVVIEAQGMPANTAHNAYALWLYNSASSYKFVGFVRSLVGADGRLTADGKLPAGAAAYHRMLITLETQPHPSAPGQIVLTGPFREHP